VQRQKTLSVVQDGLVLVAHEHAIPQSDTVAGVCLINVAAGGTRGIVGLFIKGLEDVSMQPCVTGAPNSVAEENSGCAREPEGPNDQGTDVLNVLSLK
jgi:hypothetical protein